jgi:hypothetical protein
MGRADIYPVYDQTPADYSTFDRKITLRFASDGYRINERPGPDLYNSFSAVSGEHNQGNHGIEGKGIPDLG